MVDQMTVYGVDAEKCVGVGVMWWYVVWCGV